MRVLLRTDLDPFTGDSLGLIYALLKRGTDIYLQPQRVVTPLPAEIAVLLTKDTIAGMDMILHRGTAEQLGGTQSAGPDTVTIGWATGTSGQPLPDLDGYDLLLGYDDTTTTALTHAKHTAAPVTMTGGYLAREWTLADRDWFGTDFGVAVIGGPYQAVVRAFLQAREDNPDEMKGVTLTVWTPAAPSGTVPGVRYVDGPFDEDSWHDFYADHHVLVWPAQPTSTHALQFLSTGGTVIASRGGAANQWLSEAVGYPVAWDMHGTSEQSNTFKSALLDAASVRDIGKQRGDVAARLIPDMCGWDPIIDRLLLTIADTVPGKGERVAHTARVAAERAKEKNRR